MAPQRPGAGTRTVGPEDGRAAGRRESVPVGEGLRGGRKTSPGPCGGGGREGPCSGEEPRQVGSIMLQALTVKRDCVFCGGI